MWGAVACSSARMSQCHSVEGNRWTGGSIAPIWLNVCHAQICAYKHRGLYFCKTIQVSIKEGRHFWLDLKGTTVPPRSGMLYVPTGDSLDKMADTLMLRSFHPILYLLTTSTSSLPFVTETKANHCIGHVALRAVRALIFIARRVQHILPPSTRVKSIHTLYTVGKCTVRENI